MDFVFEFADEPPHVTITTSGVADVDGLAHYREALLADPRFAPGKTLLVDHTLLGTRPLETADVRALAERAVASDERIAVAATAVVVGTPLRFGLSRMWEALIDADPSRFRTFHSRDEAIAWLRG